MEKAILNTVDKRLTFTFLGKEFVVDVTGMDFDHWDTIKDEETNIEYDINIWFDEFYNGVNSFQLCVYELVMNHDETNLTIGNSLESYDVVAINEQGLIIDGDELELVMFGGDNVEEVIEDNLGRVITNYDNDKYFVLSDGDKNVAIIKVDKGENDITDKIVQALKDDIADGDINIILYDINIGYNTINLSVRWDEGDYDVELVGCEVY
jgi:hypothetical protein